MESSSLMSPKPGWQQAKKTNPKKNSENGKRLGMTNITMKKKATTSESPALKSVNSNTTSTHSFGGSLLRLPALLRLGLPKPLSSSASVNMVNVSRSRYRDDEMGGGPRVLETQETPSEDESEFDYVSQDAQYVKDDFIEYKEYLNRQHTNSGSIIENELSPEISDGNDSVNGKIYTTLNAPSFSCSATHTLSNHSFNSLDNLTRPTRTENRHRHKPHLICNLSCPILFKGFKTLHLLLKIKSQHL